DTVNDAVVLRQFMSLSGEICLTCDVSHVLDARLGYRGRPSPGVLRLLSAGTRHELDSKHIELT
ncbi:hypothetical protein MJD09_18200, partial [bacterium]|nr:hypothetical protein [bacterium]